MRGGHPERGCATGCSSETPPTATFQRLKHSAEPATQSAAPGGCLWTLGGAVLGARHPDLDTGEAPSRRAKRYASFATSWPPAQHSGSGNVVVCLSMPGCLLAASTIAGEPRSPGYRRSKANSPSESAHCSPASVSETRPNMGNLISHLCPHTIIHNDIPRPKLPNRIAAGPDVRRGSPQAWLGRHPACCRRQAAALVSCHKTGSAPQATPRCISHCSGLARLSTEITRDNRLRDRTGLRNLRASPSNIRRRMDAQAKRRPEWRDCGQDPAAPEHASLPDPW